MPIYLDHAATTPLDPEVLSAMEPYLRQSYGNPSSVHAPGQHARRAMDEAREQIAECIGAQPSEIVFTSGGTESDNIAIRGMSSRNDSTPGHVVTTAIEHEAILETCKSLERGGDEVAYVAPGRDGLVAVEAVADALRPNTVLVSVMHANNEIGTIQPVAAIGRICRARGIAFHTDAVQSAGTIPVDVGELSCDLLSLSAHKFHGPKGIGALYVRDGIAWRPQQLGGGQERTRRSGTENVAGIVGMAAAMRRSAEKREESAERLGAMRDFLFARLADDHEWSGAVNDVPTHGRVVTGRPPPRSPGLRAVDAAPRDRLSSDSVRAGQELNRPMINGARQPRLPGNVNLSFPGLSGETLVMALDREGVYASSGSACASGSTEPSHVLQAIGAEPNIAAGALRLTLGRDNTWEEITTAARIIAQTVTRLRTSRLAAAI